MIQITTALTCLTAFLGTAIFFEYHYRKHQPTISIIQVILGYLLVEFICMSLVIYNFDFVLVLIGGTIAYATFICVYWRHRPIKANSLY